MFYLSSTYRKINKTDNFILKQNDLLKMEKINEMSIGSM